MSEERNELNQVTGSIFYRVQFKSATGWHTHSHKEFQKLDDAVDRMKSSKPHMRLMGYGELRVVRVEETIKPTAFQSND